MWKWLHHKIEYGEYGEHTTFSWFGGIITANISTYINPGIWFVYFGRLRVTISKNDDLGLTLKKQQGFLYYHFLRRSGQIGWSFPWRKYAVVPK